LHHEVVDAHGDEIDADGVVLARSDRDLELGADAVGGGDENRILVAGCLEIEESAEAAEACRGAGAGRRPGERLDCFDQGIAGVDVDASSAVILALYGALDRYRLLPPRAPRHRDNTGDAERFAMLLRRRVAALFIVMLLAIATASGQARFDVFTVAPVPVDVTAANATTARDQAISEGEQRGFRLLLERLTLAGDRSKLPTPGTAQLNDLVQGFEVAHERRSGTRYIADFTIHFRAGAVRQLLRQAGIRFAETASKPVLVLPVWHEGERTVLWDDPNPWRDGWASYKPVPGLVPLVRPVGELEDVQAIDADAAARGDDEKLQAIAHRYGDVDVLVSQATLKTDGAQHALDVTTTRYTPGLPGTEQTWVTSTIANPGESDADMIARAVAEAAGQLEEAWKAANALDLSQSGTIYARVPAASLQEWVAVRDRLNGIPAVRSSRLVSLDRGGAHVEIRYVGDQQQLRSSLAQRDLDLSGSEPDWTLERRGAPAAQR
jgi:hypothetical protein